MKTNDPAKGTVLVVDDRPDDVQVLIATLQRSGMAILAAQQGEQAFELAVRFAPDVILLDIQMPGLEGLETCRRLRSHPTTHAIPVIFLIASDAMFERVAGCEIDTVDYLTKPFQPKEVIVRVTAYVTIRRLQRQLCERNDQQNLSFRAAVEGYEKRLIASTLEQHLGNTHKTAERLHIPLRTLYRKIKKYRLL